MKARKVESEMKTGNISHKVHSAHKAIQNSADDCVLHNHPLTDIYFSTSVNSVFSVRDGLPWLSKMSIADVQNVCNTENGCAQ